MEKEYNSYLLAKLFKELSDDDMVDLLEEIKVISDPVFLFPVYEAYKKNKDAHISHYFVSTIGTIDSPSAIDICIEIGENTTTQLGDLGYVLDCLDKAKNYDERAVDIALLALSRFIHESGDLYDIYSILGFLKNAGKLDSVEVELFNIFIENRFSREIREHAFGKWIEIDPSNHISIIIAEYEEIKKEPEKEKVIARTISTWKGPKSEKLKNLIEKTGNIEAANIIKRATEKELANLKKEQVKNNEKVNEYYSTADLVEKIAFLREKINDEAKRHRNIGFILFPQNESVYSQLKIANDDATFMKACVGLREVVQDLSLDLSGHGLNRDEVKSLLQNESAENVNKSINKLYIFLIAKNFKVEYNVFGLRQVNQIAGLLGAHPKKEKDKLLKILKRLNIEKNYLEEEWGLLHRDLLTKYINSLVGILKAIKENT